jgi:hypothetical protein
MTTCYYLPNDCDSNGVIDLVGFAIIHQVIVIEVVQN